MGYKISFWGKQNPILMVRNCRMATMSGSFSITEHNSEDCKISVMPCIWRWNYELDASLCPISKLKPWRAQRSIFRWLVISSASLPFSARVTYSWSAMSSLQSKTHLFNNIRTRIDPATRSIICNINCKGYRQL